MIDVVDWGGHTRDGVTGKEGEGGFVEFGGERGGVRLLGRKSGEGFGRECLVADANDGFGGVRDEVVDVRGGGERHLRSRWAGVKREMVVVRRRDVARVLVSTGMHCSRNFCSLPRTLRLHLRSAKHVVISTLHFPGPCRRGRI